MKLIAVAANVTKNAFTDQLNYRRKTGDQTLRKIDEEVSKDFLKQMCNTLGMKKVSIDQFNIGITNHLPGEPTFLYRFRAKGTVRSGIHKLDISIKLDLHMDQVLINAFLDDEDEPYIMRIHNRTPARMIDGYIVDAKAKLVKFFKQVRDLEDIDKDGVSFL